MKKGAEYENSCNNNHTHQTNSVTYWELLEGNIGLSKRDGMILIDWPIPYLVSLFFSSNWNLL